MKTLKEYRKELCEKLTESLGSNAKAIQKARLENLRTEVYAECAGKIYRGTFHRYTEELTINQVF